MYLKDYLPEKSDGSSSSLRRVCWNGRTKSSCSLAIPGKQTQTSLIYYAPGHDFGPERFSVLSKQDNGGQDDQMSQVDAVPDPLANHRRFVIEPVEWNQCQGHGNDEQQTHQPTG